MGGGYRLNGAVVVILDLIERGHIDALDLSGGLKELLLRCALCLILLEQVDKLVCDLLAVAREGYIKEFSHGFGVADARAARNDYRGQVFSVPRSDRQSRKVEHIEHIGVAQLILHGEADKVEILYCFAALKGIERDAVVAHYLLHIHIRREHTLAPRVVPCVDEGIEYLHPEVGHTYLISVGEAERIADINF